MRLASSKVRLGNDRIKINLRQRIWERRRIGTEFARRNVGPICRADCCSKQKQDTHDLRADNPLQLAPIAGVELFQWKWHQQSDSHSQSSNSSTHRRIKLRDEDIFRDSISHVCVH
ncbi:MAG: hypothetical protein ABIR27_11315, partial [Dokdonella sp.]